tara:strand:- start:255 stop:629 length:375 start_codon:yes stop_codon:yes gene_type:complete
MTKTITLIADHLGSTAPRVMGTEYVVDAVIDITSYTANGEQVTAQELGLGSISCVLITGLSTDTIAGGYAVSAISAEVQSGAAHGGKYASASDAEFQIHVPAASNTDNVGEIRVRVFGQLQNNS